MGFTPAYKPGGNIILLFLIIFFLRLSVADKSTMSALFNSVTPTPHGWSSATRFCNWRGVKCDNKNRVTSVNLASLSLSGTLPPTLNSLTFLTTLSLQYNHFSGQIPSLANLSRLRHLNLHNNSFSTIQPRTFSGLTSLCTLSLSNNNLSPWFFPSELTTSPQLTALYASNTNMIGSIPDIFRSFLHLVNLTLSYNNLTGSLPASFNSLSSIQNLKLDSQNDNVSSNCLGCKVFIRMVVAPAPRLPRPFPEPSSGKKANVGLVVGLTILLVFMVLGFVFGVRWLGRMYSQRVTTEQQQGTSIKEINIPIPMVVQNPPEKIARVEPNRERKERVQGQQPDRLKNVKKESEKMEHLRRYPGKEEIPVIMPRRSNQFQGRQQHQQVVEEQRFPMKRYSYNHVMIMTNNFDSRNLIGEGGFGQVYKGALSNGTPVAVKLLKKKKTEKRVDDFKNEVEALGQTSHFNLVNLIGYCAEGEHSMLVYEFMRNGSLDNWIFGTNPEKKLSWLEKKRIILGIAKGLVYLHENCNKTILHRDLKPPNVLLDDKKNAKLCDFGISKLLERDQSSTSTMGLGTPGYVAPEIMKGTRISEKVDVYSFGVVVLEVLFGKRYYRLVSSNQTNLRANQLPGLIIKLGDEMRENEKDIERIGRLAISCLSDEPEARPTMSYIVGQIKASPACRP